MGFCHPIRKSRLTGSTADCIATTLDVSLHSSVRHAVDDANLLAESIDSHRQEQTGTVRLVLAMYTATAS